MPRLSCLLTTALLSAATLHSTNVAALADGYYDLSWLGGGRTTFPGNPANPSGVSELDQMVVKPDGELLLFGTVDSQTWLAGMHADGTWDTNFAYANNATGRTLCTDADGCGEFVSAAIAPNGTYVVNAYYNVVRFSPLATSIIASADTQVSPVNNASGVASGTRAMAVQSDGKVLLAGSGVVHDTDMRTGFSVFRLNADLTLDTTFANTTVDGVTFQGGIVVYVSANDTAEHVSDIFVQSDGRIVLVGKGVDSTTGHLEAVRLNADGTIDTTYADQGKAVFSLPSGTIYDVLNGILDRAGRVVVALDVSIHELVVARIKADGNLDAGFGQQAGFALFSESAVCDSVDANAVAIDSAGRIVVAGDCYNASTASYFIVVRLRGDYGSLDGSFGISGYGLGAFVAGDLFSSGKAVRFDAGGHLLVGGQAQQSLSGISRLTYDLIYTNNFESVPRGCLPPDCN